MIIIFAIFMIGVGLYAFFAPNDWEEGEMTRYNERTRKYTWHPKIGGPIAIVVGVVVLGISISSSMQDQREAAELRDAQAISSELSQVFSPIMGALREKAEEADGEILTLTAGERETAGISEAVNVYYGWCNVRNASDGFYLIVQNWNGNDYQMGFPGIVWGGCGGRPSNSPTFEELGTIRWHQIVSSSFSYEGAIEGTAVSVTLTYQETLRAGSLMSATRTPTPEAGD